jgi:predicted SAM-dependent methyltransferase
MEHNKPMQIDLGCGKDRTPGYVGVDRLPMSGVDVIADLEAPLPFRTSSIERVFSKSVMEHVANFEPAMQELHRIVRPDGEIIIRVPHFSSPLGYSDYTHKRFFGYYTFDYFVPEKYQRSKRKVPDFYTTFKFRILSKKYEFAAHFLPAWPLLRLLEVLVNSSEMLALAYESGFCYIVPCYAMEIRLRPLKA